MDPLADKLLVCSALICLIELGQLPSWMVIIIVSREFIISGFRLIAAEQGIVIAASYWGKFKTTFQMIRSHLNDRGSSGPAHSDGSLHLDRTGADCGFAGGLHCKES